ncbi:MAG TPA: DUF2059 domain-containing protein [Candidatus Saccharimonadales bacterium]|jgi:hypothetical protein|nr:DUF2059 domain-containing protein [Candidatus Saccharimonadales bacterium]
MKAVLALLIIYVGTFFVAIQGASQNSVQASQPGAARTQSIDPAKESDIRALLELIGAQDQLKDAVNFSTEQYRQKLLASMPNNAKGQAFVNVFIDSYQKNYDPEKMQAQVITIYDKHYSDDEIKGLLEFYGSPLGQKVAAEMPKIGREIQTASHAVGTRAAHEALQALKADHQDAGQPVRLGNGRGRSRQAPPAQTAAQADSSQP